LISKSPGHGVDCGGKSLYLFGDHQLLCNGFTHLVVIELAITTRV
jgi:hypothetical protein